MTDPSSDLDDADELDPDEPRTPLWLPLLGLALFLLALGYTLVTSDEADAAAGGAGGEPAPAEPAGHE